jgi:hypothetical protein
MQFVLNQFPMDFRHVSMLPCEEVPIFLEKFNECKFLFGIHTVAHVSHLGRFLRGQWDCLTECVLRLDGHLRSLGLRHDRVWVGLSQGLLQLLELCAQLKARLMSPLMEMTPHGPDIFKTK